MRMDGGCWPVVVAAMLSGGCTHKTPGEARLESKKEALTALWQDIETASRVPTDLEEGLQSDVPVALEWSEGRDPNGVMLAIEEASVIRNDHEPIRLTLRPTHSSAVESFRIFGASLGPALAAAPEEERDKAAAKRANEIDAVRFIGIAKPREVRDYESGRGAAGAAWTGDVCVYDRKPRKWIGKVAIQFRAGAAERFEHVTVERGTGREIGRGLNETSDLADARDKAIRALNKTLADKVYNARLRSP